MRALGSPSGTHNFGINCCFRPYARYYVWRGVTVGVTVGVPVVVAVGVNAHPDSAAARTSPLDM